MLSNGAQLVILVIKLLAMVLLETLLSKVVSARDLFLTLIGLE